MSDPMTVVARSRIVPVVVLDDAGQAAPLAHALKAGGLPVAEVTFRTAAAADAIRAMAAIDGVTVGAGTVVTPDQVDQAMEAGATFLVSPGLHLEVVRRAQERGIPILPGVATASDLMAAVNLGLDTVKFFPADMAGGPKGIKALSAPFVGMKFVPTGGISALNLADYLSIPSVVAVGGTWMVKKDLVAAGNWDEITRLTAAALAAAQAV